MTTHINELDAVLNAPVPPVHKALQTGSTVVETKVSRHTGTTQLNA